MSTEIKTADIQKLDKIAADAVAVLGMGSSFEQALTLADAMQSLRAAITPAMMERFMGLQNTKLGFKTDRDPHVKNRRTSEYNVPYGPEVVKDCVIEATLRGVKVIGNQFNIISSGCYITQEGYAWKLKQIAELSDLQINLGVPKISSGGAIVECDATWSYKGSSASMKATIAAKGDDYAGSDSYVGKATRKFLKRIFERITGSNEPEGEADEAAAQISDSPKQQLAFAAPGKAAEAATPATQHQPIIPKEELLAAPAKPHVVKPDDTQAESELGLAPEQPKALAAPAPGTPQADIATFMEADGVSFDKFKRWVAETDRLEGIEAITSWSGLPSEFVVKLSKDTKLINRCLLRCKTY